MRHVWVCARWCVSSPLRSCSCPITQAANSIIHQDDNNQSRIERPLPTPKHTHPHTLTLTQKLYSTISPQFKGSGLLESGVEFDQKIPMLFQEYWAGYITARKSLPLTSRKHKWLPLGWRKLLVCILVLGVYMWRSMLATHTTPPTINNCQLWDGYGSRMQQALLTLPLLSILSSLSSLLFNIYLKLSITWPCNTKLGTQTSVLLLLSLSW